MAEDYIDLFSLSPGRALRFEWPRDIREAELGDILAWLEIIERKLARSANRNEEMAALRIETLGTANAPGGGEPNPAGGKK